MTVTKTERSRSAGHDCYKDRKVRFCWSCLLQTQKGPGLLVMIVSRTEGSRSAGHDYYKDTRSRFCWS